MTTIHSVNGKTYDDWWFGGRMRMKNSQLPWWLGRRSDGVFFCVVQYVQSTVAFGFQDPSSISVRIKFAWICLDLTFVSCPRRFKGSYCCWGLRKAIHWWLRKLAAKEIPNGFSQPGHIAISGFLIRGNLEEIAMVNPMVYCRLSQPSEPNAVNSSILSTPLAVQLGEVPFLQPVIPMLVKSLINQQESLNPWLTFQSCPASEHFFAHWHVFVGFLGEDRQVSRIPCRSLQ